MTFHFLRRKLLVMPLIAGLALSNASWASDATSYPTKPIRLIVPFPAGGPTDIVARPFAQMLSEKLGQSVVADNRAGAGGSIGAKAVTVSPPDGYTLFVGTVGTNAINPSLYKNLGYDVNKDFTPLASLASAPVVIVVNAKSDITSLSDLVAKAKSNAGAINYGSAGNGTPGHLTAAMFLAKAGIRLTHVSYKGSAPAITDLLGGHIPLMFDPLQSVLPHIQSGKLRALAISSRQRASVLPNVPTVAESGFPDFEATAWWALFAPAGLPPDISKKLSTAAESIVQSPEFSQKLTSLGIQPMAVQLKDFVKSETAKWGEAVRNTGIAIE
jgi:tripartite-type tricarboxylate transporter receptor subunit TctC